MPAAAKALPVLMCIAALTTGACARGTALVQVPEWNIVVDARLSRTPQPGMDSAVPTELRLYQLRALGAFEAASYEQLQDDDKAALGESLVARHPDRIFLYPDKPWQGELTIAPGVRYIVLVAFLHKPVGRSWSYVAALPPSPAPGAMATPQQLAARPTGLTATVGPDRVAGRPVFSPAPTPERRRRSLRKPPPPPTVPTLPQPPSIPTLPSIPTAPSMPSAPSLPTAPRAPQLPPRP